jgi:threonylcarbamoyladenosine tRNA methylthiotransferase MtaB
MKKVALHNLGCKVNAYETQAMEKLLKEHGYEIVPFTEKADIYIINTCTVTNIADRKSRQMLHRAKKQNPGAVVVAAGCYVQTAEEQARLDPAIDILVGNNRKKDIVSILDAYEQDKENRVASSDMGTQQEFEWMELGVETEHTRASLKIQDGCNQFCSYCIIPYARGRIRSLPMERAVAQVEALAAQGFQEVVLTGIHISSYGKDFREQEPKGSREAKGGDLLALIQTLHRIPGLKRLRLGSLEPGIITEEFVRQLAALEKVCPHFHLSLQSGSPTVLQRMNRRYTPEEYLEKCRLIRRYFPNPALTTDVITGFPGETEAEFAETRSFLNTVDFYEVHVFKYSRRKNTKAASMEGQLEESVKAERSDLLLADGKKRERKYRETFLEKEVPVLFEEEVEIDGTAYWTGYTREYVKVAVPADENRKNSFANCRICGFLGEDLLLGQII